MQRLISRPREFDSRSDIAMSIFVSILPRPAVARATAPPALQRNMKLWNRCWGRPHGRVVKGVVPLIHFRFYFRGGFDSGWRGNQPQHIYLTSYQIQWYNLLDVLPETKKEPEPSRPPPRPAWFGFLFFVKAVRPRDG